MKKLDKKNIVNVYALTAVQEGMLFHYLQAPDSEQYFEQLSLDISGNLNKETFEKAWNVVIETNEMLRTVFRWEKVENPVQIVLKEHRIQPVYYDCSGISITEEKTRLQEIKEKDRKEKFYLYTVPFRVTLCKFSGGKFVMVISNHHILYDGWSNGIILKEFFQTYQRLATGKEIVKPAKAKFIEFVKWLQGRETAGPETFWKDYLAGSETTSLSLITGKKTEHRYHESCKGQWRSETKKRMDEFLRENKVTLAAILYSAWGIVLQRYNNADDVVFGTTVSGRATAVKGIEDMVGLFINTLPLRIKSPAGEESREMIRRINTDLQDRQEYESTPLVELNEYVGEAGEKLFDTIVVIENYPLDSRLKETGGTLTPSAYSTFEMPHYDLTVIVSLMEDIAVEFIFNPGIFEKEAIKRMSNHFLAIVEAILQAPDKEPHLLDILPDEERKRLLYDFNRTGSQYPESGTIHKLFEEQVERTPGAIAVISAATSTVSDGIPGKRHMLTYREISRKAGLLAEELLQKGVDTGNIVGIMVERSIEMAVGVLGILKAGGAYLPVNPGYPPERIAYMLTDSSAEILLTVSTLENKSTFDKNKIFLDLIREGEADGGSSGKENTTGARDLAYIIYTSGTTGKPKGVMVTHKNVLRLVKNTDFISIQPRARLLQT
ncbi:MAG: AMP-binding protein, partial [bacterium]|nr:AMP-binding protein [bacterium]